MRIHPGLVGGSATPLVAANDPQIADSLSEPKSGRSASVKSLAVSLPELGSGMILVEPKLTFAGDAGAPIVNARGELVAMGFAGAENQSMLLPLAEFMKARKLRLK